MSRKIILFSEVKMRAVNSIDDNKKERSNAPNFDVGNQEDDNE